MNNEKPTWERGASLRSLRDLAKVHLAQIIFRPLERFEERQDRAMNGEDES